MRVHLGGDHAAYDLQRALVDHLTRAGHDVVDHGPLAFDALDDGKPVTTKRIAEYIGIDERSARRRMSNAGYTNSEGVKGIWIQE